MAVSLCACVSVRETLDVPRQNSIQFLILTGAAHPKPSKFIAEQSWKIKPVSITISHLDFSHT